MPVLVQKLNFRNILLDGYTRGECVAVLLKSGECTYRPWKGFIDLAEAKERSGAKPVKLEVDAFIATDDIAGERIQLQPGQYVQGCIVGISVYGVLKDGLPRVVGKGG